MEWIKEARAAIKMGVTKDNWKQPILAKITNFEDNKATSLVLDDAWQRGSGEEAAV